MTSAFDPEENRARQNSYHRSSAVQLLTIPCLFPAKRRPTQSALPARSALHSGRSGGRSSEPPGADNKEALERLLGDSSGAQRDVSLRNRSLPSPAK